MKILKHGNMVEIKFACKVCGCEFVENVKACAAYEHYYEVAWWYLECPECNSTVISRELYKAEVQ